MTAGADAWPSLPLGEWRETYETLHMMTQIAGKVRLACAAPVNHWWHVPLYVSARGLTTSAMPHGSKHFTVAFDFVTHTVRVDASDGGRHEIRLRSRPIAEFYGELMDALDALGVPVRIWPMPVEVEGPVPFDGDVAHRTYVPDHAQRFWRVLAQADRLLHRFRSEFIGKCSPVHFFWGGFDLAVTRFSGRPAPVHGPVPFTPDFVVREAYSHECSSAGFWPGGGAVPEPAFYSYAYPAPEGFADWPVAPAEASYMAEMGEYVLPWEAVRAADDPDALVLEFLRSTYDAAAETGGWERARLERQSR